MLISLVTILVSMPVTEPPPGIDSFLSPIEIRLHSAGPMGTVAPRSPEPQEDSDTLLPTPRMRSGPYAKASVGFLQLFDGDLDREESGTLTPGDAEFDLGLAFSGAFGYRFDSGFSIEAEGVYRRNDIDRVEVSGSADLTGGDFASLTFFINGLYHFDTGSRWQPYVGAGLGWVEEIDVDLEETGGEFGYDSSGVGYQLMVGIETELDSGLGFFAEGRWFGATGFDLESEDGTGVEYDGDYQGLGLHLGVTYRF